MAELKVARFLVGLFLASSCLILVQSLDNSRPVERRVHQFEVDGNVKVNRAHSLNKRAVRHSLVRRSADDKCSEQEQTFLENIHREGEVTVKEFEHQFSNESKFSMALAWAGENDGTIIVVTTEEVFMFAKPSTLYRSTDDGTTFVEINSKINNAVIRKENGLQKDPLVPNRVYLVAHTETSNSDLYITENGGQSFSHTEMPFLLEGALMFYPTAEKKDWLLAHEAHSMKLFLSTNGGKKWDHLMDGVVSYKWTSNEKDPVGTIYAIHNPESSVGMMGMMGDMADNKLRKSTDLGTTWSTIREEVYTFGMQGKFLYCSKIAGEDNDQRIMEVSTDGGRTWNEAQLPTVTSDRFYSILDMTEGLIFMHVDNPGDTGHGTLFTSDATGIIFSQSLVKHLYPNYQDLTDFYKVQSMRGVYMASQMVEDNSIHTMVTFDRGAEWRRVKRPEGVPCKDESKACYLQIHNMYSISRGIKANPPLSVESAVGIIMVHGHVADSIQKTPPDVFVTSDGGYNWIKALDGPHHYQIADQGGLLVAISSDTPTPDTVKFSTDEGRCWHSYKFTDEEITFTGLLTEPGNRAMSVAIWGYGATDRRWRVNVLDFTKAINRQCDDDDYESWTAHGGMNNNNQAQDGCLLGVRELFQRLKKDSWCYNGHAHEVNSPTQNFCLCTKADYDCDYGYYRPESSENCVRDPEFEGAELDICLRGHEEEIVSEGYHKVPGDKCNPVGGFSPPKDKQIVLKKRCEEGDKSYIIHEVLPNRPDLASQMVRKKHLQSGLIVVCVLVAILLAVLLMGFMMRRYNLNKHRQVQYRYSVLNSGEGDYDYDGKLDNALAGPTSLYQDSSDEDSAPEEHANRRTKQNTSRHTADTSNGGSYQNGYFDPFHNLTGAAKGSTKKPEVKSFHDDSDDDMLE